MYSVQEQFIHEITPEIIARILKDGAWDEGTGQSVSSAITNNNDCKEPHEEWMRIGENTAGPNAFADIIFDKDVARILDVGGGAFDFNKHYMETYQMLLMKSSIF